MQAGGGLFIYGTATLTNTNVYTNQAVTVLTSAPSPQNKVDEQGPPLLA